MAQIDIEQIKNNYARKSDEELLRIATKDAYGLRPEVFGIIHEELVKRNLDPKILRGALAQNRQYSIDEIEMYAEYIRVLPCPICGSSEHKLNATILHTVKSLIVFTTTETELIIACPDCLDKKNMEAVYSTAIFGWWGFPSGLLKTPLYIYRNIEEKRHNRIEHPNSAMLSFVKANIGQIETYKDDKVRLKEIIRSKK